MKKAERKILVLERSEVVIRSYERGLKRLWHPENVTVLIATTIELAQYFAEMHRELDAVVISTCMSAHDEELHRGVFLFATWLRQRLPKAPFISASGDPPFRTRLAALIGGIDVPKDKVPKTVFAALNKLPLS